MSRFHLLGDDDAGVRCTPPVYIGFDVLQVGRRGGGQLRLDSRHCPFIWCVATDLAEKD